MTIIKPSRYGIIGCGRIGHRVATRLAGSAPALVAMLVRPAQAAVAAAAFGADVVCTDLAGFVARRPDVAVESASPDTLVACAPTLLAAGIDLLPLSLAAFCDPASEQALTEAAIRGPGRLEIPAGAMGSLDVLAAAREDGLTRVIFRATNAPTIWRRTEAARLIDLDGVIERTLFLRTTVRDAALRFPRNLNLSVGVALAGLGLDRTEAELYVDPTIEQARFEIDLFAGPGNVSVRVHGRNRAPGADPVDYTTFSILRLLRRRDARIAI